MVDAGTDGASVNVGVQGGTKAKLLSSSPWAFWSWFSAHRVGALRHLLVTFFRTEVKCFSQLRISELTKSLVVARLHETLQSVFKQCLIDWEAQQNIRTLELESCISLHQWDEQSP